MLTARVRSPICAVLTAVKPLLIISRNWRIAGTPMEPKNATMLFRAIFDASGLSFGTRNGPKIL